MSKPGRDLEQRVTKAFEARHGHPPTVVAWAPGRVSLLGGHVDYSEGWVLPAAIDRGVVVAAAPRDDRRLVLEALDLGETAEVASDHLLPPRPERDGGDSWVDLPAGMAWALAEQGHGVPGMTAVFGADLPMGAGVSSSAAVEMAFLLAWEALAGGFGLDGLGRARLGQRVENAYLGVGSGIMDQFASVHGRSGHALLLDCRDLSHQPVALPPGLSILVMDSGVRRRLSASGFNDRRGECQQAVEMLRHTLPDLRTLRDLTPQDFVLHSHHLPLDLRRRAQHAVEECARVRLGAERLTAGDVEGFGELMVRSHLSSRDLYEVSLPELDTLAATAWAQPGCHGARLSGGGFGGCVVALVDGSAVDAVAGAVGEVFAGEFGESPEIFSCRVGGGATLILG